MKDKDKFDDIDYRAIRKAAKRDRKHAAKQLKRMDKGEPRGSSKMENGKRTSEES